MPQQSGSGAVVHRAPAPPTSDRRHSAATTRARSAATPLERRATSVTEVPSSTSHTARNRCSPTRSSTRMPARPQSMTTTENPPSRHRNSRRTAKVSSTAQNDCRAGAGAASLKLSSSYRNRRSSMIRNCTRRMTPANGSHSPSAPGAVVDEHADKGHGSVSRSPERANTRQWVALPQSIRRHLYGLSGEMYLHAQLREFGLVDFHDPMATRRRVLHVAQ
jgi:hypothetical protein